MGWFRRKKEEAQAGIPTDLERKEFFEDAAPFIEAGLLKPIYANERFCVCNLANQCYCAFPYMKSSVGQCGILINPEYVREMAKDSLYLAKLVYSMDKKGMQIHTVVLHAKNFEKMKEMKARADANGPSPDIDFEMEAEISNIKR